MSQSEQERAKDAPLDDTFFQEEEDQLGDYDEEIDLSLIKPRPSPTRLLLMATVVVFAAWLIYGYRLEIAYFFADGKAVDLGNTMDYVIVTQPDGGQRRSKPHEFPHNTYVKVSGLPVHQAVANPERSRFSFRIGTSEEKVIYQLEGAKIFVEEPLSESVLKEAFTSESSDERSVIQIVELEGRLLSFAEDHAGVYSGLKGYYSARYGMRFCSDLSPSEVERARSELGRGGIVIGSEDQGTSFIEQESGTSASMYGVHFPKNESGVAVGAGGTILTTEDGGLSWRELPTEETRAFYDAYFDSTLTHGLVVGQRGVLMRTEDGGETLSQSYPWVDQNVNALDSLAGTDEVLAVGGEGLILKTKDGGKTWSPRPVVARPDLRTTLQTSSGVLLVAGDDGLVLRSENQGASWTRPITNSLADFYTLVELDDAILAVGAGPTVLRSEDQGSSWSPSDVHIVPGLGFNHSFTAAAAHQNQKEVVFVGRDGALARSSDGGIRVDPRSHTHATGVLADAIIAKRSIPAALMAAQANRGLPTLYGVAWAGDRLFAVGLKGAFYSSEDRGNTWQKRTLPLEEETHLYDILFTSPTEGFIAGNDGLLLHTTDAGMTWDRLDAKTKRDLRSLTALQASPPVVLYAGRDGLWGFYRGSDQSCYRYASESELDFRDAAPLTTFDGSLNGVELLLVGDEATVQSYNDTTETYQALWEVSPSTLEAISVAANRLPTSPDHMHSEHIGLAVGREGAIFRSLNAGVSFVQEPSGTNLWLNAVTTNEDGSVAFVGGAEGLLLVDQGATGQWKRLAFPADDAIIGLALLDEKLLATTSAGIWQAPMEELLSQPVYHPPTAAKAAETPPPTIDPSQVSKEIAEIAPLEHPEPPTVFERVFETTKPLLSARLDLATGTIWAVGVGGTLVFSEDAGKSWTSLQTGSAEPLLCVYAEGDLVFVGTQSGDILSSKDKGKHWTRAETQTHVPIYGIGVKGARGVAVGDDGTILVSQDGGVGWNREVPATTEDLRAVFVRQDGAFWVVGASQTFLYSPEGKNWSPRGTLISGLYDVGSSQDGSVAIAVGDDGTLLKSTDRGETWSLRNSKTSNSLRAVSLDREGKYGIVVGERGALLRTYTSGETWKKVKVELDANLYDALLLEGDDKSIRYVVAGEKGVVYTSDSKKLKRLELSALPTQEDLRALATTPDGAVIAVGGTAEDPSSVCEPGYVLKPGETPKSYWKYLLMVVFIGGFGVYTLIKLIRYLLQMSNQAGSGLRERK